MDISDAISVGQFINRLVALVGTIGRLAGIAGENFTGSEKKSQDGMKAASRKTEMKSNDRSFDRRCLAADRFRRLADSHRLRGRQPSI